MFGNIIRCFLTIFMISNVQVTCYLCGVCTCSENFIALCTGDIDFLDLGDSSGYIKELTIIGTSISELDMSPDIYSKLEWIKLKGNRFLQCDNIKEISQQYSVYTDMNCTEISKYLTTPNYTDILQTSHIQYNKTIDKTFYLQPVFLLVCIGVLFLLNMGLAIWMLTLQFFWEQKFTRMVQYGYGQCLETAI